MEGDVEDRKWVLISVGTWAAPQVAGVAQAVINPPRMIGNRKEHRQRAR
jgi:hypothetical protein